MHAHPCANANTLIVFLIASAGLRSDMSDYLTHARCNSPPLHAHMFDGVTAPASLAYYLSRSCHLGRLGIPRSCAGRAHKRVARD
eukprot:513717-Pleurochrysis_carterae.AAC.1